MNDDDLKHLFLNEQIPTPDDNARKVALNLATAEFEKTRKNENISQGNGLLARLIGRQPNHRSKEMSFSTKKVVYGGLATACAALLVYNVVGNVTGTDALSHLEMNGARIQGTPSLSEVSNVEQTDAQEKMIIADSSMSISSMSKEVEMAPEQKVKKEHSERRAAEKALNYVTAPTPNVASPSVPTGAMVGMMASAEMDMMVVQQQEFGRDKFDGMDENQIKNVKAEPISTFSIDVDTASYSFARSSLDRGVLPQKDSIRVEEMINYFDYDYPLPDSKNQPFSTNVVMKPSPWGAGKQLMTIGIKGYEIAKNQM
nr:von Willebrand factor type A domain-containing protein [Alphaproteobacteria bacterium]